MTGRVLGSVSSLHSYHPHSRHDVVFLHLLQTLEKICQYLEIHQQEDRCGDLVLMIPALEFQNLPRKYETETRCILKSPVVWNLYFWEFKVGNLHVEDMVSQCWESRELNHCQELIRCSYTLLLHLSNETVYPCQSLNTQSHYSFQIINRISDSWEVISDHDMFSAVTVFTDEWGGDGGAGTTSDHWSVSYHWPHSTDQHHLHPSLFIPDTTREVTHCPQNYGERWSFYDKALVSTDLSLTTLCFWGKCLLTWIKRYF